jgi:hypothetical protein
MEGRREVFAQEASGNAWNEPDDRTFDAMNPEPLPVKAERTAGNVPASSFASKETTPGAQSAAAGETLLFSDSEVEDWRSRWSNVQAGFVDQPRQSVEQAEELVSTVLHRLAESFTSERESLERHWTSGDNVSTEDLRIALQRYRAFFGKLLNAA